MSEPGYKTVRGGIPFVIHTCNECGNEFVCAHEKPKQECDRRICRYCDAGTTRQGTL